MVQSSALKEFLEAGKYETKLLGDVKRHVLLQAQKLEENPVRIQDRIHASEMASADWCHRATYYRLSGIKPAPETKHFTMENIFEEGDTIHTKYQKWLWEMGILFGLWECILCHTFFEAISPNKCEYCAAQHHMLRYRELPLWDEDHLITGHADGEGRPPKDDPFLIELKSIGAGTLRFEAPRLLQRHTVETVEGHKVVDWDRLWKSIKRPFPAHLRQGNIYMRLRGLSMMVFIYECKANQQTKEFVVRYNPSIVEDLFDACLDIKYALKKETPPPCTVDNCKECGRYEVGAQNGGVSNEERIVASSGGAHRSTGSSGTRRSRATKKAQGRGSSTTSRTRRVVRRPSDEIVLASDSLGRLLGRASDASRN